MKEKLGKLHIYICLLAALVVTLACIVSQVSLYRMSVWVSATIIVFYVIGLALRFFIFKEVFQDEAGEPSENKQAEPADDENVYADAYNTDDVTL